MVTNLLIILVVILAAICWILLIRYHYVQDNLLLRESQMQGVAKELKDSHLLREQLLNSIGDAVLIVSNDGFILEANPSAHRMLGGLLMGDTLLARTLCYDLNQLLQRTVQTQVMQQAELVISHPNRMVGTVRISLLSEHRPMSDPTYLVVITDLSEVRHLEQVRRDFVANVSHELRTPLAAVRVNAEALLDNPDVPADMRDKFLHAIVQQSIRLSNMTDDLLTLANAEVHPVATPTPIILRPLVQDVMTQLNARAEAAQVDMVNEIDDTLVVHADRNYLEQILINLIDNGVKYNKPGGNVRVSAASTSHQVTLKVCDSGLGISSNHLTRIFERFYRVDKSRSRASGGTGLGLAIVHHLVEAHGGEISVESQLGEGTTFTVTFPWNHHSESTV